MSNENSSGPHNNTFESPDFNGLRPVCLPEHMPYDPEVPLLDTTGEIARLSRKIFGMFVPWRDIPKYVGREPMLFLACDHYSLKPNTFNERNGRTYLTIDYAHLDEFLDPAERGEDPESDLLVNYYLAAIMARNLLDSFEGLREPSKSEIEKSKVTVGPGVEQRLSPADYKDVRLWRIASAQALRVISEPGSHERKLLEDHTREYRNKLWRERTAAEQLKDLVSYALTERTGQYRPAPVDQGPLTNQEIGLTNPITAEELIAESMRLGNK